jgi:repressor LexA
MSQGEGPAVPLTPMQRRFMLALQARLAARPDVGPTYEELKDDLGLASKSGVFRLVRECEARGRIERMPRMERGLTVVRPLSGMEAAPSADLLSTFSDADIIREVDRRGLIKLRT